MECPAIASLCPSWHELRAEFGRANRVTTSFEELIGIILTLTVRLGNRYDNTSLCQLVVPLVRSLATTCGPARARCPAPASRRRAHPDARRRGGWRCGRAGCAEGSQAGAETARRHPRSRRPPRPARPPVSRGRPGRR